MFSPHRMCNVLFVNLVSHELISVILVTSSREPDIYWVLAYHHHFLSGEMRELSDQLTCTTGLKTSVMGIRGDSKTLEECCVPSPQRGGTWKQSESYSTHFCSRGWASAHPSIRPMMLQRQAGHNPSPERKGYNVSCS